ncbi:MAG: transposase [Chromatiaceae bacterium]|nr:transposase [Chromatiaceae bacterium]
MSHDHNFKNLILDYPHQAIRGLVTREPSPEKRLKYVDFIDIYADLDDNERQRYTQLYPQEVTTMAGFAQRFTEKGREEGHIEGHKEGHKEGLQRGESRILTALLRLRFGDLPADIHQRIEVADADTLLRWSERVLTAATLDEILAD